MTSLFQVIAHDDSSERLASRKAVVLSKSRLEPLTVWIKDGGTEWRERLAYAESDAREIIKVACNEVGYTQHDDVFEAYAGTFAAGEVKDRNAREASIVSARRPKMCPFHKDVVEVSLAAEDPRAGFEALRDHWGGPRHCEGDGYKGESCKFKPQMTTQSYWDDKAEKAQERKELREQQMLEEVEAPVEVESPTEPVETPDELTEAPEKSEPGPDTDPVRVAEPDELGGVPPSQPSPDSVSLEISDGAAELMSMAAKTADTGLGGPVPKMDKRKWTPQNVRRLDVDDADGRNPTKHKDILETDRPKNDKGLTEIGEQETERQDVTQEADYAGSSQRGEQGGVWTEGGKSAVSSMLDLRDDPFLPRSEVEAAIRAYNR
jgi:hypothetical protein